MEFTNNNNNSFPTFNYPINDLFFDGFLNTNNLSYENNTSNTQRSSLTSFENNQVSHHQQQQPTNEPQNYSNYDFTEISTSPSHKSIDVIINYTETQKDELIPEVFVTIDQNGRISLKSILVSLQEMDYPITNTLIFYFEPARQMYVYSGRVEAIGDEYYLPQQDTVKIRVRPSLQAQNVWGYGNNTNATGTEYNAVDSESPSETCKTTSHSPRTPKSTHARGYSKLNIGDILNLIHKWRKLTYGNQGDNETLDKNAQKQMSLQEAASVIGIPKKTLDDYYMVIKKAKAAGYDFAKNQALKFGHMRAFVKKANVSNKNKGQADEDIDEINQYLGLCSGSKKIRF